MLEEIKRGFEAWVAELPLLYEMSIPRHLTIWGPKKGWSLHTFRDASKVVFVAVVSLDQQRGGNHAND